MVELISTINWNVVVSTAVGGVITLIVAWIFYVIAAKDLRSEAAQLRKLTTLVLRALEEDGVAEFSRDESGKIIGLVIKVSASLRGTGAMKASVDVIPRQPLSGPD